MAGEKHINILVEFSGKIGKLETGLKELTTHFTNHLHNHKIDRILNVVYCALVIIMFCYLKWA